MGIREHLKPMRRESNRCSVDKLRDSHPDLHTELLELLEESKVDMAVSVAAVSRALKDAGVSNLSTNTLLRHRRQDCDCDQ